MSDQKYPLESLFGRILSPFEDFLRRTAAGGIVLVVATIMALTLATWLGDAAVHHAWERPLGITQGAFHLDLTLHEWVNEALMALFFLLVGLELKREILVGELSSVRDAALPVIAAAGGMIVPALIYVAFDAGTPTATGWAIPMATDIAFAVGLLVLLGDRVPRGLTIFLTALAIADDLGAVLVIAIFYTAQIDVAALRASAALFVLLILFNRGGLRHPLPYALIGAMLWFYVLASGVHATVAGVLLALTIPARGAYSPAQFEKRIEELHEALRADRADQATPDDPLRNHRMTSIAEATEKVAAAVQSPLRRIEHVLTPWVAFLVIPIFALANAGIDLSDVKWSELHSSKATLGVMLGLFLGKFAGISLFCWVAVKASLGRLPAGVEWRHVLGAAWLAGIGFTMSLFISQLAFTDPEAIEQAKLGILLGSFASAVVGFAWLWIASRRAKE
ncbi:MAG: Na+/H+ antiporter NhaA [Usitatibacter sp.]